MEQSEAGVLAKTGADLVGRQTWDFWESWATLFAGLSVITELLVITTELAGFRRRGASISKLLGRLRLLGGSIVAGTLRVWKVVILLILAS